MKTFLEQKKAKKQGQRGKAAEAAVRSELEVLGEMSDFDWSRIYDARSARGRFPARPGDFEFFYPEVHGLIEAKEVEHDFRLPKKNFEDGQLARLRKRQMAGGEIVIVVYHSTTKLWTYVELEWLRHRQDLPSWDLSSLPKYKTCSDALRCSEVLNARFRFVG